MNRADLMEVQVFRNMVDGSDSSFQSLSADLGGDERDVDSLKELWADCVEPARRVIGVRALFKLWEAAGHVLKAERMRSAPKF